MKNFHLNVVVGNTAYIIKESLKGFTTFSLYSKLKTVTFHQKLRFVLINQIIHLLSVFLWEVESNKF